MDEEDYYIFNYCLAMDSAYFDRGLQGMTEIADEYLDEMIRRNKDIRDK